MSSSNRHPRPVALSSDGVEYAIFSESEEDTVRLDTDQHLLQVEASQRALLWLPSTRSVVRSTLDGTNRGQEAMQRIRQDRLQVLRHCPITGTIFTIQTDDAGQPFKFLPVLARRGWRDATAFEIEDAVEKARTQWPAD